MNHFNQYMVQFEKDKDFQNSILKTRDDFLEKSNGIHKDYINYLLLGNVQSGKTAHVLGIISQLADQDIKLFFYLTTDSVDLQTQTKDRIEKNLLGFTVLDENDHHLFDASMKGNKPLVIVLKKNSRVLKKWRDSLLNKDYLKSYQSYIIDDEADAASLDTNQSKKTAKKSKINELLSDIKSSTIQCFFIQLTATPQSILLQYNSSSWKPDEVQYFKPGEKYIGGNFIYTDPPSNVVKFIDFDISEVYDESAVVDNDLSNAVLTFLMTCAEFEINGKGNCNFMIHPSHRTEIHSLFEKKIKEVLNQIVYTINYPEEHSLKDLVREVWLDLKATKPDINHVDDLYSKFIEIVQREEIKILTINSKSDDELKLDSGFNILVGGNVISRGLTIPKLQTVYYCRSSKKPNADNFWQHSRIFGYDREKSLIRLFMPQYVYKFFTHLNDANNALIEQALDRDNNNYQFFYPDNISPTRKNVLDKDFYVIKGGKNYFPLYPNENNLVITNDVLAVINELYNITEDGVLELSADDLINVLESLGSFDVIDWDLSTFIQSIKVLSTKRPTMNNILILRYDRNLSKGTGTMLSPDDRNLGKRYSSDIVVTLYLIKGNKDKGWSGTDFWMPNIKLPENLDFWNAK
ncbi:DEAD/DEAH box helicase [Psychrobacter sp. M9-54-1]|uniref:Z1 domain-containing protein n=1 Tax=Psychrobacter sp. M9-54-1 TaxID=2782386 RepID=UPI00190A4909|nr:Z1 domain-containing protein [Psychrobacter sp. M9-54-1]MBK3393304.1 DEAD/DEAH box helicase [Psychrobacter sp. M9-54-1]